MTNFLKKLLAIGLLLPLLFFTACPPDDDNSKKPSGGEIDLYAMGNGTALEYFNAHNLAGINLGNTLDAHSGGVANERGWGNPNINKELMEGIKAAGFSLVRITITWMDKIGPAPTYTVDATRLERVDTVVNLARDAGLHAIINMHHDDDTDRDGGGWLLLSRAGQNSANRAEILAKYTTAWTQIANKFKDYGEWLMFESFNEPRNLVSGSWEAGSATDYEIINEWNQAFTSVVRATGGNNAKRILIIGAYANKFRRTLDDSFLVPVEANQRHAISFHYYDPYPFGQYESRSNWGTQEDRDKIDGEFKQLYDKFVANGVAVIAGECGVVLKLYANMESGSERDAKREEARLSRREWLSFVYGTAKKYQMPAVYWENGVTTDPSATDIKEKFGLFIRRDGTANSDESRELINLMINATKQEQ